MCDPSDCDDGEHVWVYRDNSGIEHASYEAACIYYGADTPASLADEARAEQEAWLDHCSVHDLFPEMAPDDPEIPF